ncbi:MAG TPA: hypothetical protein VKU40_13180, partial [Thermoanaerobaculia bacterium]|nr:hypothetical protein [Thermoanaerobaculia bacterium]
MSATGSGGPGKPTHELETGEAQRYFRELEDFFIALRGAPLQLSPADWQISKSWYERGIPLEHVKRVLEDVFRRRAERGAEGFVTLRYCKKPVESAWKEVEAMQAAGERGEAAGLDVGARLAALARALPEGWKGVGEKIVALEAEGDTEHVEAALGELDREMLERAEDGLGEEERAAVEAQVEETIAGLFGKLFAGDV